MKIRILIMSVVLIISGTVAALAVFRSTENRHVESALTDEPSWLELRFSLPQGFQFTDDSPYQMKCVSADPGIVKLGQDACKNFTPLTPPYRIPFRGTRPGKTTITLTGTFYYCHKDSNMCFYDTFTMPVAITVKDTAPVTIPQTWDILPRKKPDD